MTANVSPKVLIDMLTSAMGFGGHLLAFAVVLLMTSGVFAAPTHLCVLVHGLHGVLFRNGG